MSDIVTQLRKIAATLTTAGHVDTLLYAADLIEESRKNKL
jgi:hypothetical protein